MRRRPCTGRRSVAGLLAALLGSFAAWPAAAQAQPATEPAVKATYLYRFLGYVEWPSQALPQGDGPIVVGVIGAEMVAQALNGLVAGRMTHGRPVVARRLDEGEPLEGLHALYIGRSVAAAAVIDRLGRRPVLVVTDGALAPGSMLNFVVVDGRVRFEAVPMAAESAGLKLSARLLAVAERVIAP